MARQISLFDKIITALSGMLAATLASSGVHAASHPLLTPHVPEVVARHIAARVGAPDPAQRMVLAVALSLRDEPGLDRFLQDTYDPASPNFRRYVSVAEFADRFGPTAADYNATVQFFTQSGLHVIATSPNRYMVNVEGAVADVERVFNVRMGLYRHPTENRLFMAPDREPALDLPVAITHVTGLDNYELPRSRAMRVRTGAAHATGSGKGGQFLGSDVRAVYTHRMTLTGTGQTLGLMELVGYSMSDVQLYFSTVHQKLTVPVEGISTDGIPLGCDSACDDTEQALDIEYAISMAPDLAKLQVYVGWYADDVLNRMASDNTSKQLSTSWGWYGDPTTDEALFKEMAAQGQTFLTASGDYSSLAASGPWPEEDSWVTAVGGTDLATTGPGGTWAAEKGWSSSGGGPSLNSSIVIPAYQIPYVGNAAGSSKTLRNVPDVSADANLDNFICANGECEGGWGGTSFASPIWAGYIALVNEEQALLGKPPVGFINPLLYSLSGRGVFHDLLYGQSGLYHAGLGYDLVTGLGSPHGLLMLRTLTGQKPEPEDFAP